MKDRCGVYVRLAVLAEQGTVKLVHLAQVTLSQNRVFFLSIWFLVLLFVSGVHIWKNMLFFLVT